MPGAAMNDRVLSSDRGLDRSIKFTNGACSRRGSGLRKGRLAPAAQGRTAGLKAGFKACAPGRAQQNGWGGKLLRPGGAEAGVRR